MEAPAFQPVQPQFSDLPKEAREPILEEFHAAVDYKVLLYRDQWSLQLACGDTEGFFRSFSEVIEDALLPAHLGRPRAAWTGRARPRMLNAKALPLPRYGVDGEVALRLDDAVHRVMRLVTCLQVLQTYAPAVGSLVDEATERALAGADGPHILRVFTTAETLLRPGDGLEFLRDDLAAPRLPRLPALSRALRKLRGISGCLLADVKRALRNAHPPQGQAGGRPNKPCPA